MLFRIPNAASHYSTAYILCFLSQLKLSIIIILYVVELGKWWKTICVLDIWILFHPVLPDWYNAKFCERKQDFD